MDEETKQLIIGMARNIGTLKSDVGSLKSDVAEIKQEFGSDIRSLKSEVANMSFRMDSLQFDLSAFRDETDLNFSIVKDQFNEMEIRFDDDVRRTLRTENGDAAMMSRQDRLEARVTILERKMR